MHLLDKVSKSLSRNICQISCVLSSLVHVGRYVLQFIMVNVIVQSRYSDYVKLETGNCSVWNP